MKVGDKVRYIKRDWTGIIHEFGKHNCVFVNLSDESGVKFRWVHIENLEVIKCEKK